MASTHLHKFDPADHPGSLYDSFCEFIEAFKYEYEDIAKQPPAGTADPPAWIELDKRKKLLGRFASRNLQKDFEDEVAEAERTTITFTDTVTQLKARYRPTLNTTLANYEFHKLQQGTGETFDVFVNRVKHEANSCDFKCTSATCTVKDVLVRDQIVVGTSDNEIRKNALKDQWNLADLLTKGRQMEAASFGAEKIKKELQEVDAEVKRMRPGKYSRKGKVYRQAGKKCGNCSSTFCQGGEKCFASGKECFRCKTKGHFKGAEACKKKGRQERARRVHKGNKAGESASESHSSSSEEEMGVKRVSDLKHVQAANLVAHVRRAKVRKKRVKTSGRYQVPVVMKEKVVTMFADTGADVSVIPQQLAVDLDLPLVKTNMRIKPYGTSKKIKCAGYYVGPVMYKGNVVNVGFYVVKDQVEPLLSGAASEALGVISFHGEDDEGAVRRSMTDIDGGEQVIFSQYPSVFRGVGKLRDYQVTLHVDQNVPTVACPPRTTPYHLQGQLDKEIEKMEKAGIVEDHEGPAPWVSNIVLAPKDDGGVRITLDMREPNKAIQDTRLPIPQAGDIRKEMSGCKWFSKLDFKTAFHQLEISEESRYLTVFHHDSKLKRYTRLTMGTKPASGELNKALRPIFSNIQSAHVIHDDVVIATESEEEHDKVLDQVLTKLETLGLTLNPTKCMFKQKQIPFWGMLVSENGVSPDPAKVQALREATRPRNKAEVMSFLCMIQAHSEFLPKLAQNTVELRQLTRKNHRFRWTKECQGEFECLRELLQEEALLTYFDIEKPTYLLVDAHRTGISAMLVQGETIDTAQLVTCASRTTTPVERNYPHLDLEALAVDFALRRFRQYIVGGPQVEVVTDHKPLISIFRSTRGGSVRTDRIKLRHQDVNYKVTWQPGKKNRADFMSRHATDWKKIPEQWKEEAQELEKTVWFLNFSPYTEAISMTRIIQETQKDKRLKKYAGFVKKGYIPKNVTADWRPYKNILSSVTISDTGLMLKDEKIILPESLWSLAIDKAHQGGHPGETRMKTRIRSHFWIPKLNELVTVKVKSCKPCQLFTTKGTKEPISPQRTTEGAWEEVSIDLFGPLPDKKHVLVVQDSMSRFPTAALVPSTAATPIIKELDKMYSAYGQPERHRTDNGPPFNSEAFRQYSDSKGIEQVLTYPYHPQGNPCETFMKPLGKALKAAYYNRESAQATIDELLKAYRSTPHPATKVAPGEVLFRFGYKSDFPRKSSGEEEVKAATSKDKQQKAIRKEEINSSTKRTPMLLKLGDKVLIKKFPKGKKFDPLYEDEIFKVVEIEKKGVVVEDSTGRKRRRHKDDVKAYSETYDERRTEEAEPESSNWHDSFWFEQEERQPREERGREDAQVEGETDDESELAVQIEEDGEAVQLREAVEPDGNSQGGTHNVRPVRQRKAPVYLKDYIVNRCVSGGADGK